MSNPRKILAKGKARRQAASAVLTHLPRLTFYSDVMTKHITTLSRLQEKMRNLPDIGLKTNHVSSSNRFIDHKNKQVITEQD